LRPALQGVRASPCPKGWLDFRGNCYGYFRHELPWRKAQAWCRALRDGCHLASIHSAEEHRAIARFVSQCQRGEEEENVWIGLRQLVKLWAWSDGSKMRYSAWDDDEFTKGNYCAALEDSSGFLSWEDDSCGERNAFICKYAA
uniref:Dromaiocalcin-1 n=2 Tax=Dromaius novaehollandiae TaxID=8790 RepID=DCAL1_DRONO|nr:RecName: Full=Dromaiocalcin-1; Short=DCA-1 [Dromaius novaehollandiae]